MKKEINTYFSIETLDLIKTNNKLLVEFTIAYLSKIYKYTESKQMKVFDIDGKKCIIRTTKGSSSEKGVGRNSIKVEDFEKQFDLYLKPRFQKRVLILESF